MMAFKPVINMDKLPDGDLSGDHGTPNGTGVTQTELSGYLLWIIAEIKKMTRLKKDGKRQNTRFFQIVTGGNVKFVKDVVHYLQMNSMFEELDWVFGAQSSPDENGAFKRAMARQSLVVAVLNKFLFLFTFLVYICMLPIFYIWHAILHNGYLAFRKKSSKEVSLPLVFALLSEEKDMVKLFLENGASINGQDDGGNNVYHYLADISASDVAKAIRCHSVLCSCFDDVSKLRDVITEQENDMRLTGFEAIAKYGSLQFFRLISHDESCIGKPLLSVSKYEIWADTHQEEYHIVMKDQESPGVTGPHMTPNGNENRGGRSSAINLNILEFDVSRYELGDFLGRQSYPLQLIASRGVDAMCETDVTSALQSKLIGQWMGTKFKNYLPLCVIGHIVYVSVTLMLLYYIVHHDGYPYPFQLLPPFLENYYNNVTDALNQNRTNTSTINRTFPTFDDMKFESEGDETCLDVMIYADSDVTQEPFPGCQVSAAKQVQISCSPVLSLTKVLGDIFVMDPLAHDMLELTNSCLIYSIIAILTVIALIHLVLKVGFLFVNYNFKSPSLWAALTPILARRLPGSYTDRQLVTLKCVFFALYYFTYTRLNSNLKTLDALMNSVSNMSVGMSSDVNLTTSLREAVSRQKHTESVCTTILIICLLVQFLHAIHTLRLLPGIGFFVITTKKMAKHLVQFALVFVIVSLAFATIFHFVMRDPKCPALKIEGFTSLSLSLFSTYQVALGQGEHDFTYNLNAKLAYTTYTVITILLLLNLIIAVMTTTAQELNKLPWKHALCRFELWDEILGTEASVLILTSTFKRIVRCFRRICNGGQYRPEEEKCHSFEIIYMLR